MVHGRDPLWEAKRERGGPLPEPPRVSGQGIHLPHPSYWPLVAAVGVAGVMVGVMPSPTSGRGASSRGGDPVHRGVQLGVRARGLRRSDLVRPRACDEHHLETSTGLDSRKLAIWTFIGSECLFFATLISNYLVHKETWLTGPGPFPHEVWKSPAGQVFEPIIEIPLVTLGTALLLFSSLFVVLALANAQRGNRKGLLLWLGAHDHVRALLRRACRCTSSPTSCTRG